MVGCQSGPQLSQTWLAHNGKWLERTITVIMREKNSWRLCQENKLLADYGCSRHTHTHQTHTLEVTAHLTGANNDSKMQMHVDRPLLSVS